MRISEVRIKLMGDADDRLRAFCSITFDDAFVVRDLKIIDGTNGPFVAMPSRKLTAHCPQCGCKNHLRAPHCNHCGIRLKDDLAIKDQEGRTKLYADIAHPINSECREQIQTTVIAAYHKELSLAEQPGYVSRYDDYFEMESTAEAAEPSSAGKSDSKSTSQSESGRVSRIDGADENVKGPKSSTSKNKSDVASHDDGFGAGIF